jgi:uncharacterized protein (DUF1499 family)
MKQTLTIVILTTIICSIITSVVTTYVITSTGAVERLIVADKSAVLPDIDDLELDLDSDERKVMLSEYQRLLVEEDLSVEAREFYEAEVVRLQSDL